MTVLFRAADIPMSERHEATLEAISGAAWPTTVTLDDGTSPHGEVSVTSFGRASILRLEMAGMHATRSATQIRTGRSDHVSIAVQEKGHHAHEQHGHQVVVGPGQLSLNDLDSPFTMGWSGRAANQALWMPVDDLGLPHHVVLQGGMRLASSPIHDLVSAQILNLTAAGDSLAESAHAEQIGETTIDLIRALLASAYDGDYARGPMAEVLLPRIRGYIDQHLSDPSLSPNSIAHAHGISVRKLFSLYSAADISLEQSIITRRLRGAHADLDRPETRRQSIASIAQQWGFSNPSHFSRRFREMYGMTPIAWRNMAAHQRKPVDV